MPAEASSSVRSIAILLFDEVEVLDFAGPFEVFSVAARIRSESPLFNVYTVAENSPVTARGGLVVVPRYTLDDCPAPDILLVPGGWGTRPLLHNETVLKWVTAHGTRAELLLSVCTGSIVLGKTGLLDGLRATTHHTTFDLLRETAPRATVVEDERFVDNGRVVTSGGISAGIDMALHIIERLLGQEHAQATAVYMEYGGASPA